MRPVAILTSALVVGCGSNSVQSVAGADAGADAVASGDALAADTSIDLDGAVTDVTADGTPTEDPGCRRACEALIPDPLPCGGRPAVVDDCTSRCSAFANAVTAACADCVRASMSYTARDSAECDLGPAAAVVGVTGTCAVTVCDTLYPCYGSKTGDTCPAVTHCVQPCGPMQGADGICAFTQSGTCECHLAAILTDECASGATCVCPACGEGEGLCLNAPQQRSVCRNYSDQQLAAAVGRFHCP
jgi:hypothetical protein